MSKSAPVVNTRDLADRLSAWADQISTGIQIPAGDILDDLLQDFGSMRSAVRKLVEGESSRPVARTVEALESAIHEHHGKLLFYPSLALFTMAAGMNCRLGGKDLFGYHSAIAISISCVRRSSRNISSSVSLWLLWQFQERLIPNVRFPVFELIGMYYVGMAQPLERRCLVDGFRSFRLSIPEELADRSLEDILGEDVALELWTDLFRDIGIEKLNVASLRDWF